MALVLCNNGDVVALSYLVNKVATPENLVYRLFTNSVTPAETDTAGTYTEASGGGYANKTMTGASWTVTGGSPSEAAYAQQTWTFTGALTGSATVRGYYVTRASTADLLLAETFTAFTPANNGDQILLTPKITADRTP
jgi:hypothetical protein